MHSAMIHFEPIFSRLEQGILIKKALKKVKKTILVENHKIMLYLLPLVKEAPSEKAMQYFISYLKKEGIEKILLSDAAAQMPITGILKNHFNTFHGASVINYKFYDILRKCVTNQECELDESTLLLYTNTPRLAQPWIEKIYKQVRRIGIVTEHPDRFCELTEYFLEEYGLYISVNQNDNKKNIVPVILEGDWEQAAFYTNKEEKTEVFFARNGLFVEMKPYRRLNQVTVEFLVDQIYKNTENKTIRQFFHDYPVRITKIKNND